MGRKLSFFLVVWVAIFVIESATALNPGNDSWKRPKPAEVDLDGDALKGLVGEIRNGRDYPNVTSLLILRHGKLIFEEYFNGYDSTAAHTMQSVSKSFTSAMVGIALEQGIIESTDEPVLGFFAEYTDIKNLDDRKHRLSLDDLLTMRSGTDYNERGSNSPHRQLNRRAGGWDRFYLDRPMVAEPGTRFQYDSGGVILISAMIKSRTGSHADIFGNEHLFKPLGIDTPRWFRNKEGHPHMGGGLYLRPEEMARFGQMVLDGGRWQNQRILPQRWIERSFTEHVNLRGRSHNHVIGYGYLWWIFEPDPDGAGKTPIYAAYGANGQFIFVIPEHDMVVVATGKTRNYRNEINPVNFLYSHILPAVRR